jgi:hypothetical protein
VAVLDFQGGAGTGNLAKTVTTLATAAVETTPGHKAVSRKDLEDLLTHQAQGQLTGCTDMKCMADVANLVSADRVMSGSVERADRGSLVLSITLIDPAVPRVLGREVAVWRSKPDDLVEAARPLVERLLAPVPLDQMVGQLEVKAPPGAKIYVDDREVGVSPMPQPVTRLATGVRRLEVRKPGYVTHTGDVVVLRGQTSRVRVDLVDVESTRPWYLQKKVVGMGVVGAVTAGVVVVGLAVVAAAGTAVAVGTYAFIASRRQQPTSLVVESGMP